MIDRLVTLPALHTMTLSALWTLLPLMYVEVTRGAVLTHSLVLIVEMALFTLYAAVLPLEGICALGIMIKGYERPLLR